ncbi:hypothetical protein H2202_010114 [Exophiala xenobiotica]|nr:hypothetical protein H2202_010114 [Exophiala xenobiotica]
MATEVSGMGIAKAAVSTAGSEAGESLITRLCGAQGRLNSKNDGQLRYFGPTSSLHLTESVTSIFRYCNDVAKFGAELEKDIPWAMQQYLLDLYWKYQHNVLLIIHKEAFLAGMESGQSPYFNNCLLLCILVSAARISDSPEIRALAIAEEGNTNETPILRKRAEEALEKDLLSPNQIDYYMVALLKWESNLDPTISWFPNAPPGLYQLRMQHSALVILLNRHNAGFGNADKRNCPESNTSRRNCVECALLIANLVQDYSLHHGNPNTLMGSALYNITMAATIFVADIAEKNRQNTSITKELTALTACLEAMKKMESAEIVARNVRKIVQTIMRVCGVQNQGDFATNTSATRSWQAGAVADLQTAEVPMNSTERDIMDFNFDPSMLDALQFPFEEVLMDPLSANDFLQL